MPLSTPRELLIPLRDARDRIIQVLSIGVPYPLRDLPLEYPGMVAVGQPINIKIGGAETGVRYRLCDAEGNELSGNPYEVVPTGAEGDEDVVLTGPSITQDVSFTIMAVRDNSPSILLETYLNQVVEVMVGIDKSLGAAFAPDMTRNQVARDEDHKLFVDYGEQSVEIKLEDSQEGVTYQLFEEKADHTEGALLSDQPVKGLGLGTPISLTLKSGTVLTEDTWIKIKATRGSESADLVVRLTVQVRPNPAVGVQADSPIVDDNVAPKLTLIKNEFQTSVTYTLYSRSLVSTDYNQTKSGDDLEVKNGEVKNGKDVTIFVKPPARITNWDDPSGFVKLGNFVAASRRSPLVPLLTETLFIVRATKTENRETLQLNQALVVLVRPKPDPTVTARDSVIPLGAVGTVEVRNTQKGVRYQLMKEDKTPVGTPGYHWEDRGVEAMRLEVDFVVGQNEPEDAGAVLWLPTEPLTEKTTFSVMATKVITGVTKPLEGTVVIDIKPPT